jgi:hypothetical protein
MVSNISYYHEEACRRCRGIGYIYEGPYSFHIAPSFGVDSTLYLRVCDVCEGRGLVRFEIQT